jgi:hypothetical protein
MPLVIDLTGVSTQGRPPLEADDYPAVITKADIHDSKASGEPTLYLSLSVGDEGRNMPWSTSLQDQSLWRLKRLLVTLGFELPEGDFEFDEADLVGVDVMARVTQEPHYRDKKRKTNRIVEILNEDGSEAEWGDDA